MRKWLPIGLVAILVGVLLSSCVATPKAATPTTQAPSYATTAQLNALASQIAALPNTSNDVANLKSQMNTVQSQISALQSSGGLTQAQLNSAIAPLQASLTALQTQVNAIPTQTGSVLSANGSLSIANFVIQVKNPGAAQYVMFEVYFYLIAPQDLLATSYAQALANFYAITPAPTSTLTAQAPLPLIYSAGGKWFLSGIQFNSQPMNIPAGTTQATFLHTLNSSAYYMVVKVYPVSTVGAGTGVFS